MTIPKDFVPTRVHIKTIYDDQDNPDTYIPVIEYHHITCKGKEYQCSCDWQHIDQMDHAATDIIDAKINCRKLALKLNVPSVV